MNRELRGVKCLVTLVALLYKRRRTKSGKRLCCLAIYVTPEAVGSSLLFQLIVGSRIRESFMRDVIEVDGDYFIV